MSSSGWMESDTCMASPSVDADKPTISRKERLTCSTGAHQPPEYAVATGHKHHENKRIDEHQADEGDDNEILSQVEKEYTTICYGRDVIAWMKRHMNHERQVINIISTHGLSIFKHDLSDEDCKLIIQILSKCKQLTKFGLSYTSGICRLLEKVKKSDSMPEAYEICFAGYPDVDEPGVSQIIEFTELFRATRLVLMSLNSRYLESLPSQIKQRISKNKMNNFRKLEIFHISEPKWEYLAKLAEVCTENPLHLAICYCGMSDAGIRQFQKNLGLTEIQLGGIDVSGNDDLTSKGFQTLGEIVSESRIPAIRMQDCCLNAKKVDAFNDGCSKVPGLRIESLNVSNNPNLREKGVTAIQRTVQNFNVQNLSMAYCGLENFDFGRQKFESLDVSGNSNLVYMEDIACLAEKKFSARDCLLSRPDLKAIADALKHKKRFEEIDLSDCSMSIDASGIQFYAETFQNVAAKIIVHSSGMHNICIKDLQESIQDYKFGSLSISSSIKVPGAGVEDVTSWEGGQC